jgi:Carboxypeptidase regulatory-like domain/TonB dependent receptor
MLFCIRRRTLVASCMIFFFGLASTLVAQTDRGTITGTVTDPTGAVIVGAKVTATNTATQVSTTTTSTSSGKYTIPGLRVGNYDLAVEQTGFKKHVQTGIVLEVGQTVRADASLQLGETSQAVEVTADVVQVQKDTSDRGTVVTGEEVLGLPIVGVGEQRNPGYFMTLAPGVTGRGVSYSGSPRMLNTTVNGSQSASNEFQLDGSIVGSPAEWAGDFRNLPFPQDAVGEFKVMTLNPPAEFGRTGQGITSFTIRSGTNRFHGSLYEYFRNDALDARGFFPATTPTLKQNEFGGTIGGPIKQDKTFFFGWYQGFRLRRAAANRTDTVPTPAMRGGDFSSILGAQIGTDALGRPVYSNQIFDPVTQRTIPAGGVDPATGLTNTSGESAILRDAFGFNPVTGSAIPGQANIIPSNRIDPVARNIFSYFPDPVRPGAGVGGLQGNWLSAAFQRPSTNQWGTKIDHVISGNNRISGQFIGSRSDNPSTATYPAPIGEGSISSTRQYIARLSHDWILRPNLINNATAGYNRWFSQAISEAGLGWPEVLGWTGVPGTGAGSVFPGLNIAGLGNTYGNGGQGYDVTNVYTFDDGLSWIKGKHTFKTGFSYIKMQQNDGSFGRQSGYLTFNCGGTSLPGPWYSDGCGAGSPNPGFGAATFLLGLGSSGEADVYAATNADRIGSYAVYLQDDFKVTSRLTLNMGLRWDLLRPTVSAHNQMSWMDPNAINPELGIKGAVVFASDERRTGATEYKKAFGPRFGFAYSISENTVLRGGYGILYSTTGAHRSHRGLYVQGFNSVNNLDLDTSTGFPGLLPRFTLSGGWPASRFPAPPFISPSYGVEGSPRPIFPGDGRPADIQNWTLGIQRQLPGQILLDIAYVGTKGTHLASRLGPTNVMPSQYLSLGPLLYQGIGDPAVQALGVVQAMPINPATGNHSPFAGFESRFEGQATLGQSLRPFPQYTREANSQMRDFMEGIGMSNYHALQIQARKRFSHGLSFLTSYTWSKTLTDAESIFNEFSGFTQDFYNRKPEKALGLNDHPHNLVLSYQYDLPFGPGRKYVNSGVASKVIGGWGIAAIQQYQSGAPAVIVTGTAVADPFAGPNNFLTRPNVVPGVNKKSAAILNGTFDPNAPGDAGMIYNASAWSIPAPFTFGNAPRTDGDVRSFFYLNEDISIIKRTNISERVNIEFRADFLNIFNRTVFGFDQGGDQYGSVLGGNALAFGFGRVGQQGNYPREIQFGLKINY